jgi:hypothetical protein
LALTTASPEDHLPTKPIVDLLNCMVGREAIEVSDPCLKPLTPSRDEFQILVCELVPLALDPTFRLRPHSLDPQRMLTKKASLRRTQALLHREMEDFHCRTMKV